MGLGKNLRCKLRLQLGITLSRSKGTKGEEKLELYLTWKFKKKDNLE